jgi:hypothetical protein
MRPSGSSAQSTGTTPLFQRSGGECAATATGEVLRNYRRADHTLGTIASSIARLHNLAIIG